MKTPLIVAAVAATVALVAACGPDWGYTCPPGKSCTAGDPPATTPPSDTPPSTTPPTTTPPTDGGGCPIPDPGDTDGGTTTPPGDGDGGTTTPPDDGGDGGTTTPPGDGDGGFVCPYAGQDGRTKVTLCHIPAGNPGNAHTITVGAPAACAHLSHGDYVGPCHE